ncbi:hypothetical protein STANM309S_03655 [Streptomyces tanashiensis]
MLAKARKDCLQQADAIRLQMSKCSNDATTCMRVQSAPEDFARLLPKIGDSTRVTVPNMVEQFPIATLGFSFRPHHNLLESPFPLEPLTAKTVPFTGEPIALEGEFGNLAYVADLAADDIRSTIRRPGGSWDSLRQGAGPARRFGGVEGVHS